MNIKEIIKPETGIAEYNATAAALVELRSRLAGVAYDVSTGKGMDVARRDRAEVRDLRVALEKKRVELKAPALERSRLIDAEAKRITADLLELETPIDEQIKVEEQRKEKEKQDRIAAEFGRVQAIQEAIAEIGMRAMVTHLPSVAIASRIEQMKAEALDPLVFQEMMEQAKAAQRSAIDKLELTLKAKQHEEAEVARLAAERLELEQLRAQAAEQKRKDEAAAVEARKAEDARVAAERTAARVEQQRLDAEAAEARAEADRVAAAQRKAAQEALEAELAEKRKAIEAAQKAEADKRAKAETKRLKAEAAEKKMRDAAPQMLEALQLVAPCIEAGSLRDKIETAIAAAT